MPLAAQNTPMSAMLRSDSRTSRTASAAPNRRSRVKYLADQDNAHPPLRPLAPAPQMSASISTTSRAGTASLSISAVHRPV
ncbi:hypothetical protein D3C76_999210 [compost metagenome]